MPTIRMNKTRTNPDRKAGKLYNVPWPESWDLVRDGWAEYEYVPEPKIPALNASEPVTATAASAERAALKRSTSKPRVPK